MLVCLFLGLGLIDKGAQKKKKKKRQKKKMIIKSKKTKWVTLSLLTLSIVSLLAHLSVTKFSTINLVQYSAMAALRADFANVLGAPTQVCVCLCLCLCFVFLFLFFIKPRVYCKLTCKGTGIKRYSNFRIYNNSRRVLFFIHSLLPSYTNNSFFFFFFFFQIFIILF